MEITDKYLPLTNKIKERQRECGKTYGYRRVHVWLEINGIYHNPKLKNSINNKTDTTRKAMSACYLNF